MALSREGPGPCGGNPGPGTIYIPRPLGRAGLAWDLSRSSLIRSWGPGSGLKTYCLDSHGQGPGAADATWPAASCRGHWCGHRWRQTAWETAVVAHLCILGWRQAPGPLRFSGGSSQREKTMPRLRSYLIYEREADLEPSGWLKLFSQLLPGPQHPYRPGRFLCQQLGRTFKAGSHHWRPLLGAKEKKIALFPDRTLLSSHYQFSVDTRFPMKSRPWMMKSRPWGLHALTAVAPMMLYVGLERAEAWKPGSPGLSLGHKASTQPPRALGVSLHLAGPGG